MFGLMRGQEKVENQPSSSLRFSTLSSRLRAAAIIATGTSILRLCAVAEAKPVSCTRNVVLNVMEAVLHAFFAGNAKIFLVMIEVDRVGT